MSDKIDYDPIPVEKRAALEEWAVGDVHPAFVKLWEEWRETLKDIGLAPEAVGVLIVNQFIGFGINAWCANSTPDREFMLNYFADVYDEVAAKMKAKRRMQ